MGRWVQHAQQLVGGGKEQPPAGGGLMPATYATGSPSLRQLTGLLGTTRIVQ